MPPPDSQPTASSAPSPRRPWTLAQRIAALALVPTALVLISGGWWLRTQMHGALYESQAQALSEQHERVAARLRLVDSLVRGGGGSAGSRVSEPLAGSEAFGAIYSGWYWQASEGSAADARVLGRSRSLWDAPALTGLQPTGPARLKLLRAQGPLQEPLIGLAQSVSVAGRTDPVQLTVFGPARALEANTQHIDHILLASALALLVLLAAMLLVQVRVGLAPLRRLTQAIAAAREPNTTPLHALHTLPVGADLAPLQHELIALLGRNERVVNQARAHAADLNHALKKPLALLAAGASARPELPSAEVMQHTAEMTRLIDRYQARTLSDAMHARASAALPAIPLQPCLTALLQAMRKLHSAQELDWQLHLPPEAGAWHWRGDRTDLEEALGNLLDNAGKWAASQVRVGVSAEGGARLGVRIEDDGPGMSTPQLQSAGQRGLRFDESVQGTGLGLTIAGQIAEAYGGELRLSKSDALKGLCVDISLEGLITGVEAP